MTNVSAKGCHFLNQYRRHFRYVEHIPVENIFSNICLKVATILPLHNLAEIKSSSFCVRWSGSGITLDLMVIA